MRVLVVAKTRLGSSFCVGGVGENGESLRLYERGWSFPPADTPYEIGQVWNMRYSLRPNPIPPHVEDVVVTHRDPRGNEDNICACLQELVDPWEGGVDSLFDGMLGLTAARHAYVQRPRIPGRSTGFWIPSGDLEQRNVDGKVYYRCRTCEISYVGAARAVNRIPAGELVRVSLARWWKPRDADPDFPERCYLQLSGWYF